MSFQTPKGMRDFLPEEMEVREYVIEKIKSVFLRYGFEPLETPALEEMSVLEKKCGEDIKKQIYKIEGGKIGLRFDLTVPLARLVASTSFPYPFKRFCIGKVWRREEPQKGRFREFLQADIDIIGSGEKTCESELLACASECLNELGLKHIIRINNRKILDALMKKNRIEKTKRITVYRILDKLERMGADGIKEEMRRKGICEKDIETIFEFVLSEGSNEEKLVRVEEICKEGGEELKEILTISRAYSLTNIFIDFSLVRGLDYYTGPIFELSAGKEIGSVGGGGRYDTLIEMYGGSKTPAVGVSLGIERIMEILKDRGKIGKRSSTLVYVAPIKKDVYEYAIGVTTQFRAEGINTQIDLANRKLKKQMAYANSLQIPFVAIIGEKEKEKNLITLRNFKTGEEKEVNVKEGIEIIKRLKT